MLGDLMAQHPMVRWYGEIFERCKLSRAPVGVQPLLESQCCRYPVAGWEIKFLRAQHLRVIGLDLGALVDALTAIGVRHFIILERRNLLRRMVSHVVAGHTRRYQQWQDAPSPTRIMLDLDRITIKGETRPLMDWFGRIDEEYARLRGLLERQCLLELSYEDDVERDPCRGFERMCGFLDLSVPSNTDVVMRRMNPLALPEIVYNWDQVVRYLGGTRHEWMTTVESVADVSCQTATAGGAAEI